jgi:hypothetical protein
VVRFVFLTAMVGGGHEDFWCVRWEFFGRLQTPESFDFLSCLTLPPL